MRVTQQTLQSSWNRDVQSRMEAIDQLNRQLGSGLRVERPDDDPAGASRIVRIEEVVARNEQYLKNVSEAAAMNRATESSLSQIYGQLTRVKGLAVEGADSASVSVSGSFGALADELEGIRNGILQMASSRHEGKYLFSGTADEASPYGEDGGPYQGNSDQRRVNLGNGQTAVVNLPGDRALRETEVRGTPLALEAGTFTVAADVSFRVFDGTFTAGGAPRSATVTLVAGGYTPGQLVTTLNDAFTAAGANLEARLAPDGAMSIALADTRLGGEISVETLSGDLRQTLGITDGTKNVFGLLDDLDAAFDAEDSGQVGALLDRLDRALDGVGAQWGVVGSQGRNLEFARDRIQTHNVTNETLKAEIEGVDTVRAITKLSAEEQAYQTALAAGARIFNISILDFLR